MTTEEPLGFWAIAEHDPHRPALVDPTGTTYSYRELDERANRVANGLRAMGLRRGAEERIDRRTEMVLARPARQLEGRCAHQQVVVRLGDIDMSWPKRFAVDGMGRGKRPNAGEHRRQPARGRADVHHDEDGRRAVRGQLAHEVHQRLDTASRRTDHHDRLARLRHHVHLSLGRAVPIHVET